MLYYKTNIIYYARSPSGPPTSAPTSARLRASWLGANLVATNLWFIVCGICIVPREPMVNQLPRGWAMWTNLPIGCHPLGGS